MKWGPVFASTRLLEVESLHLLLLKLLVDRKDPSESVKAETFRGDMHVRPAGLLGSCKISSCHDQTLPDSLQSRLDLSLHEVQKFHLCRYFRIGHHLLVSSVQLVLHSNHLKLS